MIKYFVLIFPEVPASGRSRVLFRVTCNFLTHEGKALVRSNNKDDK